MYLLEAMTQKIPLLMKSLMVNGETHTKYGNPYQGKAATDPHKMQKLFVNI